MLEWLPRNAVTRTIAAPLKPLIRDRVGPRAKVLNLVPEGAVCAEIGVYQGEYSARMLTVIRPSKLLLIDPWVNFDDPKYDASLYSRSSESMDDVFAGVSARFAAEICRGVVELHRAFSKDALSTLGDGTLDFVYIDGDHSYDAVLQDALLSLRKLKAGGLMAFDDYAVGQWWGDDVIRALNVFLGQDPGAAQIVYKEGNQIVVRKL